MHLRPRSVAALGALVVALAGAALLAAQAPTDLDKAPRISQAEFKKLLASGSVKVIDVRDQTSYRTGHIPGAIWIPLDQVKARVDEIKAFKKPVVTYCA